MINRIVLSLAFFYLTAAVIGMVKIAHAEEIACPIGQDLYTIVVGERVVVQVCLAQAEAERGVRLRRH